MYKLEKNKKYLLDYLNKFVENANKSESGVKTQLFIDPTQNTYLVLSYGWSAERFIHFVAFHLQLKADGTIWLFENHTNKSVVEGLTDLGVAKKDIILALVEPYTEQKVAT